MSMMSSAKSSTRVPFSCRLPNKLLAGLFSALLLVFSIAIAPGTAFADSAQEIEADVDSALSKFHEEIHNADQLLGKAKGVLVMPGVWKAGIGFGGEFGEGALQVNGRTVDYYNLVGASWGLQLGAQKKVVMLLFMEPNALQQFRNSSGWKAGVDASVAFVEVGAAGEIDTKTLNKPVLAFVIGQKGLMYNLSLEGAKFTKIKK